MPQPWVILFIVHAEDGKTKDFATKLLSELRTANSSDHVRVFVLRNTYEGNDLSKLNAVLFELVDDTTGRIARLKKVKPFGKINIGDANQLADIFKDIKERNLNNARYIVITWDHGFAFGVFNGNVGDDIENVDALEGLSKRQSHDIITNTKNEVKQIARSGMFDLVNNDPDFFEAVKVNEIFDLPVDLFNEMAAADDTDILTPEEISMALDKAFGQKKIDIFIMMNCWMQSIETLYALRNDVKILIGSETTVDFIGYDYVDFINVLGDDPGIDPTVLSARIISKVKDKYARLDTEIAFDEISISAVRTNELLGAEAAIRKTLDEFSSMLLNKVADAGSFGEISKQRKGAFEFSQDYLVDVDVFFYYVVDLFEIVKRMAEKNIIDVATKETIEAWLNRNRIKGDVGRNFRDHESNSLVGGLSIYFPNNKKYIEQSTYYDTFYSKNPPDTRKKSFAKDLTWSSFIDVYNRAL